MEDKKSVMGTLRQKAKLFRYSRVGSDKNLNKLEVREERLLDQRMNCSVAEVLERSRTSSLISHSHQQPADLRPSSVCSSSPATPLSVTLRKRGGGTGLADSMTTLVDSSRWPSQESATEEHNTSIESTEEMNQVLLLRDMQLPSSESLAEVKSVGGLDLSVGLIITGGRKFFVTLLFMGTVYQDRVTQTCLLLML
ncbi:hypothetical protein DPX16_11209 [Anabarilius grahami]|uniref:Uncharacterized protein n=1 Tax=Anabarilius grahami TaxID=495550 RepID=A0A3N0Y3W0_ANAGA|nr:hypothetical protein DPX16_11209 [Anabarilius grahami]